MRADKLVIGDQEYDLRLSFFSCPVHGVFAPARIRDDWIDEQGCPIIEDDGAPCEEPVEPVNFAGLAGGLEELELRVADAYDALHTVGPRDEHGDVDEEWQQEVDCLTSNLMTALDFALTGGQGCLDDEEFAEKRQASLDKHRGALFG